MRMRESTTWLEHCLGLDERTLLDDAPVSDLRVAVHGSAVCPAQRSRQKQAPPTIGGGPLGDARKDGSPQRSRPLCILAARNPGQ